MRGFMNYKEMIQLFLLWNSQIVKRLLLILVHGIVLFCLRVDFAWVRIHIFIYSRNRVYIFLDQSDWRDLILYDWFKCKNLFDLSFTLVQSSECLMFTNPLILLYMIIKILY
ncbi:hypothetical protein EDEG_00547 [Edhazardia aedis USNM 41457]|uniref:Uncharacterized protein n=1 Tax=Edhazardia aedis (strain USNM 41457) TaxID=1003232 RepID=J9DIQ2_EDHAE|nr:hypothetical protein EDEG_00547 [Edhazardia aedis USNM 41457]|eukprot:EJW01247.1 hypothetical protein EDEG_00547 [Edhazardia aedis USNM 41457]